MTPAQILRVDAPHQAVTLTLVAQDGSRNNGFNFDDYGRGELVVNVPKGWRVHVVCRNSGPLRSSCAVVSGPTATAPAFRGASIAQPTAGLAAGGSARFSFTAAREGVYRLASLVAGQMQARMYDVLVVTRGGRPSISARPGP